MKTRKALHMEMKKSVKNAYRSASSTFKKYFGVTAVVGTLLAAPMLPSLSYAQGKISTVIENLKEMKISDLKKYMENWKSERKIDNPFSVVEEAKSSYYDVVTVDDTGFSLIVAKGPNKIQLKNGKEIEVYSTIYYKNWDKETDLGTGVSNVFIRVMNGMKSEVSWLVPLAELQDAYKEMTGNDLKYVHVIVDHQKNHEKLGEMVGVIVVAADSLEEVKGGDIKPGMPGLLFPYVAKDNAIYSGEGTPNIITACVESDVLDGDVVAKK